MDLWLECLLSVLAVWRITYLICQEEGPLGVCSRLRRMAGKGFWGELLHCFYCLSVWVSLPFAIYLPGRWLQKFIAWWGFSGAAILLERVSRDPLDITIEE
jgi:hypothetical protein